MNWHVLGWMVVALLATGAISAGVSWLFFAWQRRRTVSALHYLLDRIGVLQLEKQRLQEELLLVRELLQRRGLLDEDEITRLRQEIIELPRQRLAEQQQLLEALQDDEKKERLVTDFPETLQ